MIFIIDKYRSFLSEIEKSRAYIQMKVSSCQRFGIHSSFPLVCGYILKGQEILGIIRKIIRSEAENIICILGFYSFKKDMELDTAHSRTFKIISRSFCEHLILVILFKVVLGLWALRASVPISFLFKCWLHIEQMAWIKQQLGEVHWWS